MALRTFLDFMAWIGVYSVFRAIWQYFEIKELGYTLETNTDSVICFLVSIVVVIVAEIYS